MFSWAALIVYSLLKDTDELATEEEVALVMDECEDALTAAADEGWDVDPLSGLT